MEIGFRTFPGGKQYTYIQTHSGPVFLRNIIFLVNTRNKDQIAIVREWNGRTWEPPKGQMEWKEFKGARVQTPDALLSFMRDGVLREMTEEASVLPSEIKQLRLLPLRYTEAWPEAGKGAQFQYQFWTAKLSPETMHKAQARIATLVKNPDLVAMLPPDMSEKDAIKWWKPSDGWEHMRGAFSKKMTTLFYKERERYGV
jgi:hypothetical protein